MRRMWTKSLYAQRAWKGAFHCVLDDIYKLHDAEKLQIIQCTFTPYRGSDDFATFLWCSPEMYLELLERMSPRVRKETVFMEPIDPALTIALTLHYLGTGKNYHTSSGCSTSSIIPSVVLSWICARPSLMSMRLSSSGYRPSQTVD